MQLLPFHAVKISKTNKQHYHLEKIYLINIMKIIIIACNQVKHFFKKRYTQISLDRILKCITI